MPSALVVTKGLTAQEYMQVNFRARQFVIIATSMHPSTYANNCTSQFWQINFSQNRSPMGDKFWQGRTSFGSKSGLEKPVFLPKSVRLDQFQGGPILVGQSYRLDGQGSVKVSLEFHLSPESSPESSPFIETMGIK